MNTNLTTATTAETAATTAVSDALAAKTALETARDKVSTGWGALKTAATSAAGTANTNLNTANAAEQIKMGTMKTAQMGLEGAKLSKATIEAACTYTGHTCDSYADDPIKALKTANTAYIGSAAGAGSGQTKTYSDAKTAWDTTRDDVATKKDLKLVADVASEVASANWTTNDSAITTATGTWTTKKGELTTATAAKTTANTNLTTVTG